LYAHKPSTSNSPNISLTTFHLPLYLVTSQPLPIMNHVNSNDMTIPVATSSVDDMSDPTTKSNPFPFLRLPSELRNLVYSSTLPKPNTAIFLRYNPTTTEDGRGVFALINVNKQVRAEFRLLLMNDAHNWNLRVCFTDYPAFVKTFFPPDSTKPRPLNVRVYIEIDNYRTTRSYDMRPLMLAKATTRGLQLKVYRPQLKV
jgi:hypothetical protein